MAAMLKALKSALDTEKERGRLLALPRSAERARKLLTLLNKLEPRDRLYHLHLISRGLLTREETNSCRAGEGDECGAEAMLRRLAAAGHLTLAQARRVDEW